MLPRRYGLAVTAVVDIALHARGQPVAARALAERHGLRARHLEPMLQDLVRAAVLKGTRGPRGGYELARERRRISAGDIVRAVQADAAPRPGVSDNIAEAVVAPALATAIEALLAVLDGVTVEDLCRRADGLHPADAPASPSEFHI